MILIVISLDQVGQELEGKGIITVIDSDTTDYFFIDYADFVKYEEFQISLISKIAEKMSGFEIVE